LSMAAVTGACRPSASSSVDTDAASAAALWRRTPLPPAAEQTDQPAAAR
jgi:hypothetical protein